MEQKLLVGYGRMDMLPEGPIELGGLGNGHIRVSENVLDTLMVTCIAVTDPQDETVLLLELDLVKLNDDWADQMRGMVSEATGVPVSHIMVAASHTHSGPEVEPFETRAPRVARFMDRTNEQAIKAARKALEDRKPTRMYGGISELPGMNYVRHYWRADGVCASRGTKEIPVVSHTADSDPRLQLVRFEREEGKDILLMNWQAHPTFTGQSFRKELSADYIAPVRTYMEMMGDCHFVFFQAGGGNLTATSQIASEPSIKDMYQYARVLSNAALAMVPDLKPIAAGPVKVASRRYVGRINHTLDHREEEAKDVWAFWEKDGTLANSWPYAQEHGFPTPYAAQGVLYRKAMPVTQEMEINAICLGELAIGTMPGEIFDTCAAQVKDESPFPMTLFFSLVNGYHDYFPNHHAYSYGCYETTCCYYEEGTCEELAENVLELLGQLK